MKILGWMMQCMLRNKTHLIKDSRHDNEARLLWNSSRVNQENNSWPKIELGNKAQNGHSSKRCHGECDLDEVFPGFLTIGTLNMEPISCIETATPMFGWPSEAHQTKESSYELKVINDELQKFVKEEGENQGCNESRRTSVASTITLSGKDKCDNEEKDSTFPLQEYLFASSYDLSVSEEEPVKERASLLELFRRSGVDKNAFIKVEMIEDQGLVKRIAPMNPMRKIIQTFQPCVKKNNRDHGGGSTQSSTTTKSFHKIRKLFERKVHPEGYMFAEEVNKLRQCKKAKRVLSNINYNNNEINEGSLLSGNRSCKRNTKNKSNEQWIRTDEDYVILELGQK